MSRSGPEKDAPMPASLPSVPQFDPQSNLSRYLQDIRKFPLLEPDEEFMLAKRWREHGDTEAAHRPGDQPSAPRRQDRRRAIAATGCPWAS